MSLLNEVLKDIDLRRRDPREQQILTSILISDDHEEFDWFTPVVIAALVLVCGALTWWVIHKVQSEDRLLSTFELPMVSVPLNTGLFNDSSLQVARATAPDYTKFAVAAPRLNVADSYTSNTASSRITEHRAQEKANNSKVSSGQDYTPVVSRKIYPDPTQPLLKTLTAAVTAFNNGEIGARDFVRQAQPFIASAQPSELEKALNAVEYEAKNRDALLIMLDLNRQLMREHNLNRNQDLHRVYDQLRLKSVDAGYWSFLQAILFDKESKFQEAAYYYQLALQTEDLTAKQRQLSSLRVGQLSYEMRNINP